MASGPMSVPAPIKWPLAVAAWVFQSSQRPLLAGVERSTNRFEYCLSFGIQSTSTASTSPRPEPAASFVNMLSCAACDVAAMFWTTVTLG